MDNKIKLIILIFILIFSLGCTQNQSNNNQRSDVTVVVEDLNGNKVSDFLIYAWSKSYSKEQPMFMGDLTNEDGIITFLGLTHEEWIFFYQGIYDSIEYDSFSYDSVQEKRRQIVKINNETSIIKLILDKETMDLLNDVQTTNQIQENEYNNANVVLTIKDKNNNLVTNQNVMFSSKNMLEKSKSSNWQESYTKSSTTDENGILRIILDNDEYIISLQPIQSSYISNYTKIPLNNNFKIINIKGQVEKTIVFDNDNELQNIQNQIKSAIQLEQDKQEQQKQDQIEQDRQEMCDPKNENALMLCCAKNYYNIFESYQTFSSKNIKINQKFYSNKMEYEFIVNDNVVGNYSDKIFQDGNLLIEMLRCSGNSRSIREEDVFCCVKIIGLKDNQKFIKLNQKNTINNKEIQIEKDIDYKLYFNELEYLLKDAILLENTLIKLNSSVHDIYDQTNKEQGLILDIETISSNDYILSKNEEITIDNWTINILDINKDQHINIQVNFNNTTETKLIEKDKEYNVNNLNIFIKEIYSNLVWLKATI
jgi:hypothetical protein